MARYTKGQIVSIYQKPITQEEFEGKARLVRFLASEDFDGGTLETWRVNFPEDGLQTYERRILFTH